MGKQIIETEQFMMAEKARVFGDQDMERKILASVS